MNHARGRHGAHEYFCFAVALIVLLIGSAARAAAADDGAPSTSPPAKAAQPVTPLPVIADADGVHYPRDSRRFEGDGLGQLALRVRIDQAI